ncbi:LacI family transcriptional regulator [Rhodobacteraceae bacterium CCMM004]|nr:LacI family transcriptional regulator [Rhodobacteraceae bacterium CCMM004]
MTVNAATTERRTAGRGRVTISDLAAHLGVTKSTVSRALNGYSDIAEATQLRVKRAAAQLGYRPLSHAQAIRTGRSRALGFVLQSDLHDGYRPFLSEFLAGMTHAASTENWTLTVAQAESEDDVLDTFERLIAEHKVDGFVLPRTKSADPRIDRLRAMDVPFVLFGRTARPDGCAWFDISGETAMAAAVARLADMGHRRIAHIGGAEGFHYTRLRAEGYRDGLRAAGLPWDPRLVCHDAAGHTDGRAAARRLLTLDRPPTAIVAAVDLAALGAYQAIAEAGLTVGREVSVIAYDGTPLAAYAAPPLTTFSVDSRHAGARLAALLIARIRGAAPEDLREVVEATLIVRGSDGPPVLTSHDLGARLAQSRAMGPLHP